MTSENSLYFAQNLLQSHLCDSHKNNDILSCIQFTKFYINIFLLFTRLKFTKVTIIYDTDNLQKQRLFQYHTIISQMKFMYYYKS